MKVLIVEDEYPIALDIEQKITSLGVEVIGITDNYIDTIDLAMEHHPDLTFMDINIQGKKNGIETAEYLIKMCNTSIVFLTAYSNEKTISAALEVNPVSYLVKPFNQDQLKSAILQAKNLTQEKRDEQKKLAKESHFSNTNNLFIKDKYKIVRVVKSEIIRLEAMDNYTQIFTTSGRLIVHLYLSIVLEKINLSNLIRVHRSHAVNIDKISHIKADEIMINEQTVPIGKKHKIELLKLIDIIQ